MKLAADESKLAGAVADKEREQVELRLKQQLAANKAEYDARIETMKQERAALDRKFAEMALQLDQQQAKTKSTNDKAKVSKPLRELPQKAKVLGRVLSAKGLYKADGADGRRLHAVPRYDSMDPVPHSLDALAASGALEDSPRGVPLMGYLLGGKVDTDWPRVNQPSPWKQIRSHVPGRLGGDHQRQCGMQGNHKENSGTSGARSRLWGRAGGGRPAW